MNSRVFAACVTIGVLTGCASTALSTPPVSFANPAAAHGSEKFKYTGAKQKFKVPAGVAHVTIDALGAAGGGGGASTAPGGNGGLVKATIAVTPGETLGVFVGGANGGFNGGGPGSPSGTEGGGGASDVRQGGDTLTNRVVIAGGGGGGG
ncbi:MAG: hypothetical protein JO113_01565, partial [Candidatus Eremiobacteraeota bacterium]|nr:hypothetical protein [Candidatus Eremiobacteraeota bacterium]